MADARVTDDARRRVRYREGDQRTAWVGQSSSNSDYARRTHEVSDPLPARGHRSTHRLRSCMHRAGSNADRRAPGERTRRRCRPGPQRHGGRRPQRHDGRPLRPGRDPDPRNQDSCATRTGLVALAQPGVTRTAHPLPHRVHATRSPTAPTRTAPVLVKDRSVRPARGSSIGTHAADRCFTGRVGEEPQSYVP